MYKTLCSNKMLTLFDLKILLFMSLLSHHIKKMTPYYLFYITFSNCSIKYYNTDIFMWFSFFQLCKPRLRPNNIHHLNFLDRNFSIQNSYCSSVIKKALKILNIIIYNNNETYLYLVFICNAEKIIKNARFR